ncbi:MAG: GntR family transcriptional regulator [Erysipelotrichaceae bacterium]
MKTKEIKQALLSEIEAGAFNETKKLPTEDQLVAKYQTTKYSIRRILDELVEQCVVYRVQGSGVYIRENKRKGYLTLSSTKGISNEFQDATVTTKILSMEVTHATLQQAEIFGCDVGSDLYHLERLRLVDGVAFALETSTYNKKIVPYLNQEIVESSIFEYIQTGLGLDIGFADKRLEARKLSPQEAALLDLEPNDPTIVIHDTVYLKNGRVFNDSQVVYHYQHAKFFELAQFKK